MGVILRRKLATHKEQILKITTVNLFQILSAMLESVYSWSYRKGELFLRHSVEDFA